MHSCPNWSDDSAERDVASFRHDLAAAYAGACKAAPTKVLDHLDLLEWHVRAFSSVVPLDYYAGNFRQDSSTKYCLSQDVSVGGVAGSSYTVVLFHVLDMVGAVRDHIIALELEWATLSGTDRAKRVAYTTALLVGVFIRIHPFLNGNGRMSRVLWAWALSRFGLPAQCRILKRPAPPYGDLMKHAMRGDIGPLLAVILKGMAEAPSRPIA